MSILNFSREEEKERSNEEITALRPSPNLNYGILDIVDREGVRMGLERKFLPWKEVKTGVFCTTQSKTKESRD